MEVRLLHAMAGAGGAFSVGDVYECAADEAKRLIEGGIAEPIKATSERATAVTTETAVPERPKKK